MITTSPCATIVVGPDRHGVVRHALSTARTVGSPVHRHETAAGCPPASERSIGPAAHVHYTDRLFGPDATTAASAFTDIFAGYRGRLVVTLHDVPFGVRTPHDARRTTAYRDVIALADVVVVCSEAEALRVAAIDPRCEVQVVRIPIRSRPITGSRVRSVLAGSVGIIGFVYPGKGHAEVIDAASAVAPATSATPRVMAIGAPSPGHDGLVDDLHARASAQGVAFELTGYVSDRCLGRLARRVAVPIVASTNTSASASLSTWIEWGRRPLVAATDYTVEFDRLHPGSIDLYDPTSPRRLAIAIGTALADPDRTRRTGSAAPAVGEATSVETVVAALADLYRVGA